MVQRAFQSLIPSVVRRVYTFNQNARDQWVAALAARIPAGSRVLDVGAGSCPYRSLFAHCEYRSHDFAQLQPGQLSGYADYGLLDYVSDITAIPVLDASFDVILCTEVLEHVPEPIYAVKEFARILKSGGKLFLSAPLGSGLHQEPYHYYGGYTPYWYFKFLRAAGFEMITVEPNGGFFKHYAQEGLRLASLLAPWRGPLQWLLSPVWLLSLPWLAVIWPWLATVLDRIDRKKAFTVGYHVSAVRCR